MLFNGIRVGEVTGLELDARQSATGDGDDRRRSPARRCAPTPQVGIDFQGLTGVAGDRARPAAASTRPLAAAKGEPPLLVADPTAGQSMTQAARDALRRIDDVLAENAEPLHDMIANLDTFSGALARNSDRVDGIVAGLERMTGGAAAKARVDRLRPRRAPRILPAGGKPSAAQLVIPDPTALAALDTDKIQSMSRRAA